MRRATACAHTRLKSVSVSISTHAGTVERHDAVAWLEVLLRGSARMVVGADCPRVNDAHACDDDGGEFMAVAPPPSVVETDVEAPGHTGGSTWHAHLHPGAGVNGVGGVDGRCLVSVW